MRYFTQRWMNPNERRKAMEDKFACSHFLKKSEAYNDMSITARLMYLYMKVQPVFLEEHTNRLDLFIFPISLWRGKYHLCTNNVQFNKFCDELIEHGFIELYQSGKYTRTPNVYKYSNKWQQWKKGDDFRPPEIKKQQQQ
jgi:hypothetical protein